MPDEKIEWIIKHLRYTQALCEIIIENIPETDKNNLIEQAHKRVNDI